MAIGVMFYSFVKQTLEEANFKVGYTCIGSGNPTEAICCFWYRGNTVIRVSYLNNLVKELCLCNEYKNSVCVPGTSSITSVNYLAEVIKYKGTQPPTILDSFTGVLFEGYTSNSEKYTALTNNVNKFSRDFLDIYQNEINAITKNNTSVTQACSVFDCFKEKITNKYFYVTGVSENTVLLLNPMEAGFYIRKYSLYEVFNDFIKCDTPTEYKSALYKTLNTCYELLDAKELIATLQQLGYKGSESLASIKASIQFNPEVIYSLSENLAKYIIIKIPPNFEVIVSLDRVRTSLWFREPKESFASMIASIKEVITPQLFLSTSIQLCAHIIEKFQMILHSEPELNSYLYSLLICLQDIQDKNKGIKLPESWDVVGTAPQVNKHDESKEMSPAHQKSKQKRGITSFLSAFK